MAVQTKKYLSGQGMGGKKKTPLVQAGGVRQLALSIRRVNDKELSKEMKKASKDAAEKVVPFAKRNAPLGATGKLRRSIKATATRSQGRINAGNNRKAGPAAVPYLVKEYEQAMKRIAKEFTKKHGVNQMKGAFKK